MGMAESIGPREATMQVEERRACPSCGADNPDEADFCWQCFARFVPVPLAPGAPSPVGGARMPQTPNAPNGWGPGGTPAPSSASLPPSPAGSSGGRGGTIAKIAVGVVVGLIVAGAVRNFLAPDYHVPDSVGGAPRIENADTAQFEQEMAAEGEKEGLAIEAAVYGAAATPDLLFVLVNGEAAENTDELFDSFVDGIATSGVTVERDRATTGNHGDAEFRCLPLAAQGLDAAACMWREDASVGMTLDLTPDGDVSGALIATYDATHA